MEGLYVRDGTGIAVAVAIFLLHIFGPLSGNTRVQPLAAGWTA
jgi:hypothetical protein